jgi:hypothetical protein
MHAWLYVCVFCGGDIPTFLSGLRSRTAWRIKYIRNPKASASIWTRFHTSTMGNLLYLETESSWDSNSPQSHKKHSALYGLEGFILVFETAHYCFLSRPKEANSALIMTFTSSKSVLVLFSNLYSDYSNDVFTEHFPTKLVYVLSACFVRLIYSTHIIRPDSITLEVEHRGRLRGLRYGDLFNTEIVDSSPSWDIDICTTSSASRLRFPIRSLIFSIYLILQTHYGTWVYSVSNRNEYQLY